MFASAAAALFEIWYLSVIRANLCHLHESFSSFHLHLRIEISNVLYCYYQNTLSENQTTIKYVTTA